jgi:hypothetical protein
MRKSQIVLVMSAIVLCSSWSWAQRPGGRGFGGSGGGTMLLGQESVQQELKLSPEQIKQVDEYLPKQRETFSGLRDLSQQERRQKLAELAKANQGALGSILDETQQARLKQIALQQRGTQALADPEVAEAVGLDDEQKGRVRELDSEARAEMQKLFQDFRAGDRTELRKKFEAARNAVSERIQALLTPEQQAKWKDLVGEPFQGEIRSLFRRGGRGDGDGGNRRRRPPGDSESTNVVEPAASRFRLAGFRDDVADDDADDGDADDKKSDARRKNKPDADKSRADKHRGPKHSKRSADAGPRRGHPRSHRSFGSTSFARRPTTERDRAWARVAQAVGHRASHRAHRGPGRGFAHRGHHGPEMRWAMHRRPGGFGGRSFDHHRRPSFAAGPGFRGAGQKFRITAWHARHGHGPMRHHGHHGPLFGRHHRFDGHGPMMAHHQRPGPSRSFSFDGHRGHRSMHMAGFKKHGPHGQFSQGKPGDHRRGDSESRRRSRDDDRDNDRDNDRGDNDRRKDRDDD